MDFIFPRFSVLFCLFHRAIPFILYVFPSSSAWAWSIFFLGQKILILLVHIFIPFLVSNYIYVTDLFICLILCNRWGKMAMDLYPHMPPICMEGQYIFFVKIVLILYGFAIVIVLDTFILEEIILFITIFNRMEK